jgi:tetratricopeptide (TPR) repeat protein
MCRLKAVFLVVFGSIFACSLTFAQGRTQSDSSSPCRIEVRVAYADERPVGQRIRVELLNAQGVQVEQTYTDGEGQATFQVTGGGSYRAQASGPDIEQAVSELVDIQPHDQMSMIWLHVQPKTTASSSVPSKKGSSRTTTTANELRVPADAKKLFLKGMDALYRHDYRSAAEQFERATIVYPQYDAAFDNLGATYMQLGETDKARAAFERAVQLNDKNADAERNYARVLLTDQNYTRAIELLTKALTIEPQDPASLTLLAMAQLRTGDLDAALQNALRVHQLQHQGYAVAHYVAGRAYELKQQYPKATSEYETYLREDPNGPEARQVRSGLVRVTASAATAQSSTTTPQ